MEPGPLTLTDPAWTTLLGLGLQLELILYFQALKNNITLYTKYLNHFSFPIKVVVDSLAIIVYMIRQRLLVGVEIVLKEASRSLGVLSEIELNKGGGGAFQGMWTVLGVFVAL